MNRKRMYKVNFTKVDAEGNYILLDSKLNPTNKKLSPQEFERLQQLVAIENNGHWVTFRDYSKAKHGYKDTLNGNTKYGNRKKQEEKALQDTAKNAIC